MPLTPGTRLGPYEILAPLGAGGMGEVYRARDTRLHRDVALKVLPPAFKTDRDRLRRFQQEARIVAALNHPHICQIFDVGPDYLVLECVDGAPLRGPVPAGDVVRFALQISGALETAHRRGILHRDLKPENILVNGTTAKVLDFGIAKLTGDDADATRTTEGALIGTVAYMSPEQADGRPVDERSDVFSLGTVLYELLSGTRPFGGETIARVVAAVLRDDPGPIGAPPALERIVMRCLAKAPAERFQTMSELRAALEGLTQKAAASRPSIAVLPFANMSADSENEYFSDGLAEEIINALAHIPDLKVIARTSAFAFKGKHEDVRRIADALDVVNILEGSVRRSGNRIRVTAQLITAADGSHLWSERYDRDMTDVFAIQDEIAQAIAAALEVKLSTKDLERRHTPALPSYDAFLRARHAMLKFTPQSLALCRELYTQAIALDSSFALPHSDLGWCYMSLATENLMPVGEAARLMRASAGRALDIDPSLQEAQGVLAIAAVLEYDWQEAGRRFQMATAQEPVAPLVRYFLGAFYLAPLGRTTEAILEARRALQDDPLNLAFRTALGMLHLGAGQDAEGSAELRQVIDLDASYWIAGLWLCAYHVRQGALADALALAERVYTVVPANYFAVGLLSGVLSRLGDEERARRVRERLGTGEAYGAPAGFVCLHTVCSEMALAADWFEKAIAQRDTRAPWILSRIFGTALTSSPRWPALARMMNLPAPAGVPAP